MTETKRSVLSAKFIDKLLTAVAAAVVGGIIALLVSLSNLAQAVGSNQIDGIRVPQGAIIAFDLREGGGCPQKGDWEDIGNDDSDMFSGRVFIVAGNAAPDKGIASRYAHRQHGGQEHVRLQHEQMPRHSHFQVWGQGGPLYPGAYQESTPNRSQNNDTFWGNTLHRYQSYGLVQTTSVAGGTNTEIALPHENRPPFIALTFCKKL